MREGPEFKMQNFIFPIVLIILVNFDHFSSGGVETFIITNFLWARGNSNFRMIPPVHTFILRKLRFGNHAQYHLSKLSVQLPGELTPVSVFQKHLSCLYRIKVCRSWKEGWIFLINPIKGIFKAIKYC